jgi:hypothetical protein
MTSRRPNLVVASLVLAMVATLVDVTAAAGQPVGRSPGLLQVTAAATATMRSTSAVRIVLQGASVDGAAPPPVIGTGAFDFPKSTGSINLAVPAPGGTVAVHRTLFLPTVVYVRPPSAAAASLPAGKEWIVASLTQIESNAVNFPQFVLQEEGLSPLLELQQLIWGAVSATPTAARSFAGAPAQGYVVRVDLRQAEAAASGPAGTALLLAIKTELSAFGPVGSRTSRALVTEKIWLQQGRVVALQLSPPGAGVGVTTTTLSRYGTRVRVSPPPVSSVVDIASLTPSGEQESGPESDIA